MLLEVPVLSTGLINVTAQTFLDCAVRINSNPIFPTIFLIFHVIKNIFGLNGMYIGKNIMYNRNLRIAT